MQKLYSISVKFAKNLTIQLCNLIINNKEKVMRETPMENYKAIPTLCVLIVPN